MDLDGFYFYHRIFSLKQLNKRFDKDVKAMSDELQCEHSEKICNDSLTSGTDRESNLRLSFSHHFDLKLKGIMDIIEVKNPYKPFSLEQNSFIVQFLTALEKPLKEIKQSLANDEHQNIAFSRIEEKIRGRLTEELKTIRDSHSIFNTYKGSLAVEDGMEKNLRLEEDFKIIFSKLLNFGFEDLATRAAFKKIEENGFNPESVEILKILKTHINDFHEQKQGRRADLRIFKNPFADLDYQNFLEAIFAREIKASSFLESQSKIASQDETPDLKRPQSLKNLDNYLNFSEGLLKSKLGEISPNELFEVKLKHKILQNLDEINYKADLDISNFKKLINIIDENRALSLTRLPSIEEYRDDKLKNIFSKRDGENKLTKLNLEGEQFATLIRESTSTELKNEAEAFLLRSLKSVQSMPNFIGIVSTLGNLKVGLEMEHRQQISEFISEKIKDFNERKDFNSSSYENFILGMQRIYDPEFSLKKLTDSLDNGIRTIPENNSKINIKRNQNILTEFKEKDLLKKLSSPNEDIKNNALKEIKQYFKESQSADEFQRNSHVLPGILNFNRKELSKELRQKCIAAAFDGYMENRQGDEEIELLKIKAVQDIY
jgi:hypothetical protein